jgi:hypothetical protein
MLHSSNDGARQLTKETQIMRVSFLLPTLLLLLTTSVAAGQSSVELPLIVKPGAFPPLVNPACSHCKDEAKRRADLKATDRVLCWIRGYSEGGAIPLRFFLNRYRVISDSYGVFVHDSDAGYVRGFAPSYDFRFHGWRNGVMVMKHKDGTLYSCLSGVAFAGPKRGMRLQPIPTLVSDWGVWLEKYPNAVTYHMFDKYQPVELPARENAEALKSWAGNLDRRLEATAAVLGTWTGKAARAYPLALLEKEVLVQDEIAGDTVVVLWEPSTRTAAAYRPVASQPRKYKGPRPGPDGVSPPDEGTLIPPGALLQKPRRLSLRLAPADAAGRFEDSETKSLWDIAGRCVSGELKGWTLEWVDGVQVKWFAWIAEYPQSSVYTGVKSISACADHPAPAQKGSGDQNKTVKEVAGTAEFLRVLPKPFATLKAVDPKQHTVTLLLDGETTTRVWPVEPDAELKVGSWWGRLENFQPEDRVWVWLKLNRKKQPVAVVMLADEVSEYDFHGSLRKSKERPRFTPAQIEARRTEQKTWLRRQWLANGLPGTVTFLHIFSGELEIALDHEAMRWGRSLRPGDVVQLTAEPPIKSVVRTVTPWRERTMVRLVVGQLESSELKIGQRLGLKMTPPAESVETSVYPADIDRPRSKAERTEWFLASIYCTCGVDKDVCTGHFYTLASCNPNGCGMPKRMRANVAAMVDQGLTDHQIWDALTKQHGPLLLRPHLLPGPQASQRSDKAPDRKSPKTGSKRRSPSFPAEAPTMPTAQSAMQDWYANQLREYVTQRYGAHLAFERTQVDPEAAHPQDTELSPSATRVRRAERDRLPAGVREAFDFYWEHFEEADIGFARVYQVRANQQQTYAVRVRTDGDDGFLEVYDAEGNFLVAGRTYLEIVAWGNRDWLRAQVAHPANLPPELRDAHQRTLWGKPLPQ